MRTRELSSLKKVLVSKTAELVAKTVEHEDLLESIKPVTKTSIKAPLCQFCKNPLNGPIIRRPDGYYCCRSCSLTVFKDNQAFTRQ